MVIFICEARPKRPPHSERYLVVLTHLNAPIISFWVRTVGAWTGHVKETRVLGGERSKNSSFAVLRRQPWSCCSEVRPLRFLAPLAGPEAGPCPARVCGSVSQPLSLRAAVFTTPTLDAHAVSAYSLWNCFFAFFFA